MQRQAPYISFELMPTSERAVEALESGNLDFLIAPEVFASNTHPKMPLFEDTHTVIAWTRNRNVGRRISLEQYLSLGHVAIHVGEGVATKFRRAVSQTPKVQEKSRGGRSQFRCCPTLGRGHK